MDNELLAKLLTQHTRLVIPGFGAFLCKESGSPANSNIVFSPFLRKDDGVLSDIIAKEYGVENLDAEVMIGEYVTHLRSTLQSKGKYYIEGVGILALDANGAISMVSEPKSEPKPEPIKVEPMGEPVVVTPIISAPVVSAPVVDVRPAPVAAPIPSPVAEPVVMPNFSAAPVPRPLVTPRPAVIPQPIQQPVRAAQPMPAQNNIGGRATIPSIGGQQRMAMGAQPQQPPRPVVPVPNANVNGAPRAAGQRPMPNQGQGVAGQPRSQQPGQRPPQRPAPRKKRKSSPTDIWLIIAIVVAALVIVLIVYGLMVTDPTIQLTDQQIEQLGGSTAPLDSLAN